MSARIASTRVLLEQSHLLRPEDRDDVRALGEKPGERELRCGRSLGLRDLLDPIDESRLHSECRSLSRSVPGPAAQAIDFVNLLDDGTAT
jgi:hypothetical protein